jgi:hypothetical protein
MANLYIMARKTLSQLIQITAIIVNYTPNAMHDSFDDGSFEFYDATKILIVMPKTLFGLEWTIYHTGEVAQDSQRATIGMRIIFTIDKDELVDGMTLFDGAVLNLSFEKKPVR